MEDRPLGREFRTYQSDLLAGRTRVESLRRVAHRLEVSSVTILVSALVQAEQLGSGIAQALRRQADDLRDRRRERANAFAMALPVNRMIPAGDLLSARHLRVDAGPRLGATFPDGRHLHAGKEILILECGDLSPLSFRGSDVTSVLQRWTPSGVA